jgi:hypothetical protein
MTNYTTNFCPNPSIEYSTLGYAPITGTEQLSQVNHYYSGQFGLQVTTPGRLPGEGISTPAAVVAATVTGSASVSIFGETGLLTIQAIQNPGGQILGTFQVQLNGQDWQRIELDNLAMTVSDNVYLVIYTTTAQALTFLIDAVQYEPESPAHPYIDGDSPNCTWTGTPGASASYQQFQHPTRLSGGMLLEGTLGVVAQGEVFGITLMLGQMDMSGQDHPMVAVTSPGRTVIAPAIDTGITGLPWEIAGGGSISCTAASPGSGFSAFGIWETGVDPDPAMTLIGSNNAGTDDGATGYAQLYGAFTPPQQVLSSSGSALWNAAAYMAAGFRIASQAVYVSSAAPNAVNFAQLQIEKAAGSTPGSYQLPRSLLTIVKPTNLNYVPNPGFETSGGSWDQGWTAIGGATLTQQAGGFLGSFSMQVSVPSANGGVYVTVPGLILGDMFTASAYVEPVSGNIADIEMSVGSASVSANATGYPYGVGAYGSGPYGGVNLATAPMTTGSFAYRPWLPFAAPESTVTLSFIPVAVTSATYPLVFNIDCVMVAPGEVLTGYGDGSVDGWQWEAGGTPGLCRSYFYERENVAASAIQSVLDQHIPLGLSAYEPVYAAPPTQ